ncbi:MAG: hypothetical protein LC754_02485 [Acidobacteria bacterium]|nr:hypothetical protein [Acidobacteriota bacterium]
MNELGLAGAKRSRREEAASRWRRFWRRQFDDIATPAQVKFDVVFGIMLPVLCFIFDPVVFRGGLAGGGGLLAAYSLFAYGVSALEMTALGLWLVMGRRLGVWSSAAGGILLAGALFSFTIGLLILPLTLIGMLFIIGFPGLTPFFTTLVYLRSGLRAVRATRAELRPGTHAVGALALGTVFALGVPAALDWQVSRTVSESLAAALEGKELSWAQTQALKCVSPLTKVSFDPLALAYAREADPQRKAHLAQTYRQITGRDVEERLRILSD